MASNRPLGGGPAFSCPLTSVMNLSVSSPRPFARLAESPTAPAPAESRSHRRPAWARVSPPRSPQPWIDLDHPVSPEDFLGLGEGPVGHLRLPAGVGDPRAH